MEFAKVKQEVINDDSTWNQWEKDVEFGETIKNEDLIPEFCSEEVYIKDEFDEKISISLHTGSEFEVPHSIPTVLNDVFGNRRLDIGKEAYIGEEALQGFPNIPEHSQQKLYSCKTCDDYQVMADHAIKRSHICQICKLTYDNKAGLVRHMQTHNGNLPFACHICKYECLHKAHLVVHMRTHTGERPFACDVCKHTSARKADLVRHMRTHTGERPFACDICKYNCSLKSTLDMHKRSHTGERPFACDVCEFKCSQKTHLDRHKKTHNGERPFACTVCRHTSARKADLVKHMRTHSAKRS